MVDFFGLALSIFGYRAYLHVTSPVNPLVRSGNEITMDYDTFNKTLDYYPEFT